MRPQGWQTSRCRHPTRLRDARRNYLTGEIRRQCSRLKCRERTLSRSEVLWRSHRRHPVETARQPSFRQTLGGPYRFRCRQNRWSRRNRARHFRLLAAGACRRLHPRLWNQDPTAFENLRVDCIRLQAASPENRHVQGTGRSRREAGYTC